MTESIRRVELPPKSELKLFAPRLLNLPLKQGPSSKPFNLIHIGPTRHWPILDIVLPDRDGDDVIALRGWRGVASLSTHSGILSTEKI
jgi:hypothetical protein